MKRTPLARRTPLKARAALARVPRPRRTRPADDIPQMNRFRVKLRADFHCEACGLDMLNRLGAEMHHRQPKGMGGRSHPDRHSPANLLFLCPNCHRDITNHPKAAYDMGHLVRRGHDPGRTAVLVYRYGWVTLDDAGSYTEAVPS